MRALKFLLPLALFAGIAWFLLKGLDRDPREIPSPLVGRPAPAVSVPLLGGVAKKRFQPMIDVHLDFVEAELAGRPWIAGDVFTAADVMMSFPLQAARIRAGAGVARAATSAWLDKIQARAAYQAALERGGPFESLR